MHVWVLISDLEMYRLFYLNISCK